MIALEKEYKRRYLPKSHAPTSLPATGRLSLPPYSGSLLPFFSSLTQPSPLSMSSSTSDVPNSVVVS